MKTLPTDKLKPPTLANYPPITGQPRRGWPVQHTPGPWTADKFSRGDDYTPTNCRVTSGKKEIASTFYGATDGEREANARLIAAAPELLAALEVTLSEFRKALNILAEHPHVTAADIASLGSGSGSIATKAIAKAKGGAL